MGPGSETVVLVHGLWVHGIAMALMRRRVARCGYRALTYSYPSMRLSLAENAQRLARFCRGLPAGRLHLVGHSLGGLIVLRMLEETPGLPPGRIVVAGTPFAGSYAADRLCRLPGGRRALGRSMPEGLTRGGRDPGAGRELGVIAGSLSLGLGRIVAPDLPGPNDGAVTVAETAVPGAQDRIVIHVSHSGMLLSLLVARQVCAFLRDGAFFGPGDK